MIERKSGRFFSFTFFGTLIAKQQQITNLEQFKTPFCQFADSAWSLLFVRLVERRCIGDKN